jgi:hypothetical protein
MEGRGQPSRRRLLSAWLGITALVLAAACSAPAPSATVYPVARDDARFAKCGGDTASVIAAFPLRSAFDYYVYFPKIGYAPNLVSDAPAFVVVFVGRYPGPLLPQIIPGGQPFLPSLAPGHHDLCIWVGDAASGQMWIYGDVDATGLTTSLPSPGSVYGIVCDAAGQPIRNAGVAPASRDPRLERVPNLAIQYVTDGRGRYASDLLLPGPYRLHLVAEGYPSQDRDLTLHPGQDLRQDFVLPAPAASGAPAPLGSTCPGTPSLQPIPSPSP